MKDLKDKGQLLDTNQIADYLNRTPAAIRNLVMRRMIPFRKVGGRLLFLENEIDQWVDRSEGVRLKDL